MIIISMILLIGLIEGGCSWPTELMTGCVPSPCASATFRSATPTKEAFINPRLSDICCIEPPPDSIMYAYSPWDG